MYTWEEIQAEISSCTRCPLSRSRHLAVPGQGSFKADLMFVAEAPGAQEDQMGVPFIGPAGTVFDELLSGADLSRQDIYLTNIIKCHPPGNRDPKDYEKDACFPYLKLETYLLKPKIIVCLGRVAAQRLIEPNYRITRQHGTWIHRKNCYLTAVYHPSALLRDPSKMEDARRDFKEICKKRKEIHTDPANG